MAVVPGHHSDLPTNPMQPSAASAANASAYFCARGVADGAVTRARLFAVTVVAGPGAEAPSAVRPAAAECARLGVGAVRAISAAGSGATSPSPTGAAATGLGSTTEEPKSSAA